jgi:hypothetical protein
VSLQELKTKLEALNVSLSEVTTGRDTYRSRYLEEREAKKCLEQEVNRVKKECRA